MSVKFFLISQVFYPDEVSTANLFTNLSSYLAKEGVDIEVWAAQPSYTCSVKQPGNVNYEGINIKYLFSTRFHKSNFFGSIINILSFMVSASIKLLFTNDKTPVFTHTTPPLLGIIISIICALKRRKFIYILLDIYPEGLIRLGKLNANNLLVRFWKRANINALKRSFKIIVIGRDMREYVHEIYPESVNKIEYIPNWQDDRLIHPADLNTNSFFKDLNHKDSFVVQYSGNMGLWNDMEAIGKATVISKKDVFFVFIGDGIRKNELQRNVSENHNNYIFLPFQPTDILSEVLTSCHVALVSLRKGMEGMAVPCKIYGILAAGTPVIALVPENSEIAYVIEEEKCGIVVPPDDYEGLNNAIIKLMEDNALRIEFGANGRRAFEKKYTTKIISDKYIMLLNDLYKL